MLDKAKSHKISVLNKMIGLGEEVVQPPYMVPQNSINNFRQKAGLNEISKGRQMGVDKCPHCENMAKNFLYLESLIRNNSCGQHCRVCHSSLGYLQYVNKSILEVFGNFDSIVKAARAFREPVKFAKVKSAMKQRKPLNKVVTSSDANQVVHKKSSTKNRSSSIVTGGSQKSCVDSNFSLKAGRVKRTVGTLKRKINLKSFSSNALANGKKSTKSKTKNILRKLKSNK